MSHFVVLVFGEPDDLEAQLEPYNENTEMPPYWEDETTDMTAHWAWSTVSEEAVVPITTMEEYATALVKRYEADETDKYRVRKGVLQRQTTYNPQSQWDWWTVGGRWRGLLLTKDGRTVDEARIADVDWEGMQTAARTKAEDSFDLMWNIIGKREKLIAWTVFREKYPDDIPRAREEYNAQETLQVLRTSRISVWEDPAKAFCLNDPDPRAAYIQSCVDAVPFCYAMVQDGVWGAMGRMGWWGMSKDDMTDAEWKKIVRATIEANPEGYVTAVDCHI